MSRIEYCYCGETLEWIDSEWAKYCMSDSEEIVDIYKCPVCGRKFSKREGNFDLDLYV